MPRYTVTKGCVGLGRVLVVGEEVTASAVEANLLVASKRLALIPEPQSEPEVEAEPEDEEPEKDPPPKGRRKRETATAGDDRETTVDE